MIRCTAIMVQPRILQRSSSFKARSWDLEVLHEDSILPGRSVVRTRARRIGFAFPVSKARKWRGPRDIHSRPFGQRNESTLFRCEIPMAEPML